MTLAEKYEYAGGVITDADIDRMITVPTPRWAADEYAEMARALGFSRPPALRWKASAEGSTGLHSSGQHLIVIGEDDLRQRVAETSRRHLVPIRPGNEWRYAHVFTPAELYRTHARVVMAHELGHAARAREGLTAIGIYEERGADRVAGWVAEVFGWKARGDELVMDALGCREAAWACTHDNPAQRVRTYHLGRGDRREQAAAEQREAAQREAQQRAMDAWLATLDTYAPYYQQPPTW